MSTAALKLQSDYIKWYCSAFPNQSYPNDPSIFMQYPLSAGQWANGCPNGNCQQTGNGNAPKKPTAITNYQQCANNNPNMPSTQMFEQNPGDIVDINDFLSGQRSGWTTAYNPYGAKSFLNPTWAKSCCWETSSLDPDTQQKLCASVNVKYNHDSKFIPTTECDNLISNGATGYCDQLWINLPSGNILNTQQNIKDPSMDIQVGTLFKVANTGTFMGQSLSPGDYLQAKSKISKDACKTICKFEDLWLILRPTDGSPPGIDSDFCACYNINLNDQNVNLTVDEKLYKALKDNNPDLPPNCVVNKCHSPSAYKSSEWASASCPNVCSAISSDPSSDSYVGVTCGKEDIIVNNIPKIISGDINSQMTEEISPPNGNGGEPLYRTPLFYILLTVVLLMLIFLIVRLILKHKHKF